MSKNKNLRQAKKAKNDEFYTQLHDIEKELMHYRHHFKGKVVYCNCDDPTVSNFFKYFSNNFEYLGLKKLIATCYQNKQVDLFSQHKDFTGAKVLIYEGDSNKNTFVDKEEIGIRELKGDGDFRSEECIELLKQADIVVTNPPFSLFREYIDQLVKYDKQFLVLGSLNGVKYKDIFPLIKNNKIWLGYNNGIKEYGKPDGTKQKLGNTIWFTNLSHDKRNEELFLFRKYSSAVYPKYDNYDAIEVSKVVNIPKDYDGLMGVPITFLDKYNPNQFEIVGLDRPLVFEKTGKVKCFFINGRELYSRIVIRRR